MRMRILSWGFVVSLGLILAGVFTFAPASAQSEPIYGLVTVDNAEVRSGPDFAYPAIGRLPLNASVVVVGRAGDFFTRWDGRQWIHIEYGSGRAWIYGRLLRTSVGFNSLPPTGRILPRDGNGRVPQVFDLSMDICERWQGAFTQSGDFMNGDTEMIVTYPELPGATVYSTIVISPSGNRTAFDSTTTTATILLNRLPNEAGTYTWRIAPYWSTSTQRWTWQQICLLRTGGTFDKPFTGRPPSGINVGG